MAPSRLSQSIPAEPASAVENAGAIPSRPQIAPHSRAPKSPAAVPSGVTPPEEPGATRPPVVRRRGAPPHRRPTSVAQVSAQAVATAPANAERARRMPRAWSAAARAAVAPFERTWRPVRPVASWVRPGIRVRALAEAKKANRSVPQAVPPVAMMRVPRAAPPMDPVVRRTPARRARAATREERANPPAHRPKVFPGCLTGAATFVMIGDGRTPDRSPPVRCAGPLDTPVSGLLDLVDMGLGAW